MRRRGHVAIGDKEEEADGAAPCDSTLRHLLFSFDHIADASAGRR